MGVQVLNIKKYNEMQTNRWNDNYDKTMKEVTAGTRHLSELPQLAFYVFNKSYGYVAFDHDKHKALWAKTKKEVISWWEDEEIKRKVRGW